MSAGRITYYVPPSKGTVRAAMLDGRLGAITTPKQGNLLPLGVRWVADNGCFGKGYPGDAAWLAWLESQPYSRARCGFATAPDVVGDAAATLERSRPHLPAIRELGYPAALVGQDGLEELPVPWDEFDVLFIGGSTDWKMSAEAAGLVEQARERGLDVHMGRVNSLKRLRYAESIGCTSVDGTYTVFGPEVNGRRLLGWLDQLRQEQQLAFA